MLDIGWSELVLIVIVAILVIGPKDLPVAARTVGRWVRAVRRMAKDFQYQLDEVIHADEIKEIKEKLRRDLGDAGLQQTQEEMEKHFAEINESIMKDTNYLPPGPENK